MTDKTDRNATDRIQRNHRPDASMSGKSVSGIIAATGTAGVSTGRNTGCDVGDGGISGPTPGFNQWTWYALVRHAGLLF